MKIKPEDIPSYSEKYDQQYQDSDRLVESELKPWLLNNRSLGREAFLQLCCWKSKRPKKLYALNTNSEIVEATKISFTSRDDKEQIYMLLQLKGVSYPVASAILHFAFPHKYPILDFRVIWSLGWSEQSSYNFQFWKAYCEEIRIISEKTRLPIRTLDKALWAYSKEHQPPKRHCQTKPCRTPGKEPNAITAKQLLDQGKSEDEIFDVFRQMPRYEDCNEAFVRERMKIYIKLAKQGKRS